MVHSRVGLVVLVITLGMGLHGCSKEPSADAVPPPSEADRQTAVEGSRRAKRTVQWWRDETIVAELELTDDQVEAINGLMIVSAGDASHLRDQERQLSTRYLRALAQEPYDPELVDRVGGRLVEVLSSEHRRRIEGVRELRDILTEEQWTKLWDAAPRALQIGRFRIFRGPRISVSSDPDAAETSAP